MFSFENLAIVNTFVSARKMEKILKKEKQEKFAFLTGLPVPEDDEQSDDEESDLQPIAINDMKAGMISEDEVPLLCYT